MIRIRVTSNAQKVIDELEGARKKLPLSLRDVVLWGAIRIQTTARGKYMLAGSSPSLGQGQVVKSNRLHRRTGRLSRSINIRGPILTGGEGGQITNAEATVGTNVSYGAHWELGFHGTVAVKSHTRRIKQAFGRKLKEPKVIAVRPYSRKVDDDARPFLQPARDDEAVAILKEVRRSIAAAFHAEG